MGKMSRRGRFQSRYFILGDGFLKYYIDSNQKSFKGALALEQLIGCKVNSTNKCMLELSVYSTMEKKHHELFWLRTVRMLVPIIFPYSS
jgi:hypothetical protein